MWSFVDIDIELNCDALKLNNEITHKISRNGSWCNNPVNASLI